MQAQTTLFPCFWPLQFGCFNQFIVSFQHYLSKVRLKMNLGFPRVLHLRCCDFWCINHFCLLFSLILQFTAFTMAAYTGFLYLYDQ